MTDEESFLDGLSGLEPDDEPGDITDSSNEESVDVDLGALFDEIAGVGGEAVSDAPIGLEEIKKERDEYLDALRHLQADFENFRKRMARQQTETLERASLTLVERLLPVLDALDLALAHVAEEETESAGALVQIAALARTILEKEGLERIDEVDVAFDPTIHDAVSHLESDGSTSRPTVVEVFRSGYRLKGKVIRPAMVVVRG